MQRTASSGISLSRIVVAAAVVVMAAAFGERLTAVHAKTSPMAREWVGKCQDGKAFMLLDLKKQRQKPIPFGNDVKKSKRT